MQQTDFKRFRDVMRGMGRIYGAEPDAVVLDAYWLALRDWSLDEFEDAAAHLMKTQEFMPKPASFTALRKAARPLPAEAWQKALAHCASGAWRRGPTGITEIDRVADMLGGYETIALYDTAKLGFLERRFCEHYESIQDADDVRQSVPAIAHDERRLLS